MYAFINIEDRDILMPTARPVKPDHSISEVAFVLHFSQPLSEKQLQSLTQLEDVLKDELPKMDLQQGTGIKISSNGQIESQPSRLLSLAFKRFNNEGELEWTLRAEGNFIAVNCMNYSGGWKNIWPKVRRYLEFAAPKLISTESPLESLALQYIDRFIFEGQIEWYKTSTIFNDQSEYLTRKATKAGPFWHVHQGWFYFIKEFPSRILNKLNITAAMADKEHHTTIDHSATIQFKKKVTNYKSLFDESIKGKAAIDYYFDFLHEENKQVLRDLLNDDRIDDIKLTAT